jgi:hypothetical protein
MLGFILISACQNKPKLNEKLVIDNDQNIYAFEITAQIIDSINTAKLGAYKLDLRQLSYFDSTEKWSDSVFIAFDLCQKSNNYWKPIQSFRFEKEDVYFDVIFEDYNNDGYGDFQVVTSDFCVGSNKKRKMFIFKPNLNKYVLIKGYGDEANLSYDTKYDCVLAFPMYGSGYGMRYFKIQGDSLCPIASVETVDKIQKLYFTNEKGDEVKLMEEPFFKGCHVIEIDPKIEKRLKTILEPKK